MERLAPFVVLIVPDPPRSRGFGDGSPGTTPGPGEVAGRVTKPATGQDTVRVRVRYVLGPGRNPGGSLGLGLPRPWELGRRWSIPFARVRESSFRLPSPPPCLISAPKMPGFMPSVSSTVAAQKLAREAVDLLDDVSPDPETLGLARSKMETALALLTQTSSGGSSGGVINAASALREDV